MRVWIDLSNSPHPLIFEPVARRLRAAGADVALTARDNAQTAELARSRWPDVEVIGTESPAGRAAKARALLERIGSLIAWARRRRPDVALSHNSYAQLVAARVLRLPAVTAMDFEHQPANHVAFRAATRILLPEALPPSAVRRQGAVARKLRRYPGLKEELYLGDFQPDPGILGELGVDRGNGEVVVVARTPPARAAYHRFGNPLFGECLRTLGAQERVRIVVLPRHAEQRREIEGLGLGNCVVPDSAIDSRSLIREADLMIGAGGTMTREAALMGIPTFSLFAGKRPAVDAWLEGRGRISRLTEPGALAGLAPRANEPESLEALRERARLVEDAFVETTLSVAEGG